MSTFGWLVVQDPVLAQTTPTIFQPPKGVFDSDTGSYMLQVEAALWEVSSNGEVWRH